MKKDFFHVIPAPAKSWSAFGGKAGIQVFTVFILVFIVSCTLPTVSEVEEWPVEPYKTQIIQAQKQKKQLFKTRAISALEKEYDWNKNGTLELDELAALRQTHAQKQMIQSLEQYNQKTYEGITTDNQQ